MSAGVRGENAELWVSGAGYDSAGQVLFPWSDGINVAVRADGETAKHGDLLGRAGPFTLRAAVNDRTKMVPTGRVRNAARARNHLPRPARLRGA